jgi:hypothetical protein
MVYHLQDSSYSSYITEIETGARALITTLGYLIVRQDIQQKSYDEVTAAGSLEVSPP